MRIGGVDGWKVRVEGEWMDGRCGWMGGVDGWEVKIEGGVDG